MDWNDQCNEDARTIYCANLSDKVTEELLYELFLQAGPLERVKIPTKNNFGFVTYQHECSVDYALEIFKDTFLYGCALRIKRRIPKNSDERGPRNTPNPLQTGNYSHLGNMNQGMMPSRDSYRSRSPPRWNRDQDRERSSARYDRYDNRQNKRYDYDDKYDQRHSHNDRRSHKRYKR